MNDILRHTSFLSHSNPRNLFTVDPVPVSCYFDFFNGKLKQLYVDDQVAPAECIALSNFIHRLELFEEFRNFEAMGLRNHVFLLLFTFQFSVIAGETNSQDFMYLTSLKEELKNTPNNWVGSDPCNSGWVGIWCNNSRVTTITLSSIGLIGSLSDEIASLSELQTLDLSGNNGLTGTIPSTIGILTKLSNLILVGCNFFGVIPYSIGSLQNLVFLSLNSNRFSGRIPPSIGKLSKLYWLDLADNQLEGPIPVSNGSTPGLDMLLHAKHFHLGQNKLSGPIPSQLFNSSMHLIHVLFDGNKLSGSIPSTLGLVTTLEVVRLDGNMLSGPVPSSFRNLTSVSQLYLSNNRLTGPIPDLTTLNDLTYLDMSNNSFDVSDIPPWFSTLQSLTTLMMQSTRLAGQLPVDLFSLPNLQTVVLSGNQVNGTLTIGSSFSNQLELIDLRSNLISEVDPGSYSSILILVDNPICLEGRSSHTYCTVSTTNSSEYSTPPWNNCLPSPCSSNQISSPNCICAHPYTGTLVFRGPTFSNLQNTSRFVDLQNKLMDSFQSKNLPVNSVSLSNPAFDDAKYLELRLAVFPSDDDHFNKSGISNIGFVLNNQTFKPPKYFGPFYFHADTYQYFGETPSESKKSSSLNIGIIIGVVAGVSVLLVLLVAIGICAICHKKRSKSATGLQNPFAQWDSSKGSGDIPQLKGASWFSYDELKKYTNNFAEANEIGSGGYGKVYRGTLPTGKLIAIKRALKESMQGGLEFKTELELLSRVHHKNLVALLGFCFEQGEQMLIYEYVPNGNLRDSLSGKTGIRLDWTRRLKIAVGAARGILYLHELANPPIIHRDIKSNNILLDDKLNAKVADFGLSKLMTDGDSDHVTTQVKGTMGYLDPEYYMTQQLTDKSDVYGFGVLMLEIITARKPIEQGKYIVRLVRLARDNTKPLYGLEEILDPALNSSALPGLEKFVDLAMSCLEETGARRPSMGEVVKLIESIMVLAGLNPNAESVSTSASYEEVSKGTDYSPYSDRDF